MRVHIKRAYDPVEESDGRRVLVDRLWPRGLKRESLSLDDWLKDIGPSDELRRWFGHEVARWPEFQRRYGQELDSKAALVDRLARQAEAGTVTLLFGAKDREHNNAAVLRDYLAARAR